MKFYGSRNLTVLAKNIEGKLQDMYVVGHWESTLLEDLLWTFAYTNDCTGPWPPTYRPPSWSWLSVEGAHYAIGRHRECPKLASIISYYVQIKGENPYGEVEDGWIKLRAPMIRLYVDDDDDTTAMDEDGLFTFLVDNQNRLKVNSTPLDYNADLATLRKLPLFAVLFGRDTANDPDVLYPGLFVTPAGGGDDLYRRLAMCRVYEESLGECKPSFEDKHSIITLV